MCDTLCYIGPLVTLFAKNSDRPSSEVQLIESYPVRPAGGSLRTTHIEIPDVGAYALMGSRPEWMWGFEHGVNEHRVAIGNEKVYTVLDPNKESPALTGMDLVRLGLERGRTADEALELMAALLEEHGQGGVCDQTTGESYFSSILIASPGSGWILETSGRIWVAAPIEGTAAISNRLTLRREWTRSSADVPAGADWDDWRHPRASTGHADVRLAASQRCLASSADTPEGLIAHLRDHGGARGVPEKFSPEGDGITVCMHLRGFQNTTSAMVAELPSDLARPLRAWVAPGQPCVTPFVPVFPPDDVPRALGDAATWHRFEALRNRVDANAAAVADIRAVLEPLEHELWAEVDVGRAWERVDAALRSLEG